MLLRTSSTPVIQTLLSDSPNRDFETRKSVIRGGHNLGSFSCCCSSPSCISTRGFPDFSPKSSLSGRKTFKRAQSDSNLQRIRSSSFEEFWGSKALVSQEPQKPMLHSEPSFSIYTDLGDGVEAESENGDLEKGKLAEGIEGEGSGEFSFGKGKMGMIEEYDKEEEVEEVSNRFKELRIELEGVGVQGSCIEEGVDFVEPSYMGGNGGLEEYYKRMISEYPSNPLLLRNYAQLLQSKRDFSGAEEYYYLATLADPNDGELLHQYAELVWELHRDQEKASIYFEKAAHAAPGDSHILAAYARFLWKIDEKEEEEDQRIDHSQVGKGSKDGCLFDPLTLYVEEETPASPPLYLAVGLGIDVGGLGGNFSTIDYTRDNPDENNDIEWHYVRMIEENPYNPLFLRNYAEFLLESKGDHQGAEEYYSRAILVDPTDGEIISQYANLVWQFHHDKERAVSYFERAVQANPEDSNVLASYAKFLWETEEQEEGIAEKNRNQVVQLQVEMTGVNA